MAKGAKTGGRDFTKGDSRIFKGGRGPSLPARVQKWLGNDLDAVAETFGRAVLTGKLSFDHIKRAKVRRIDTADVPEPRTLTPGELLQFVNAAGLIPKHADEAPEELQRVIRMKIGKALHRAG